MKKTTTLITTCLLLSTAQTCQAWNISGVLKSKLQTDNRYSQDARTFGEVWGSLEVFDYDSWHGGLDFVSRESDNKGFEADIYQLYMQKTLQEFNSTIKVGRFQRADSMGYYALDGLDYQYTHDATGISTQFYVGTPRRLEDMRSISGDWLYGLESQWQQDIQWNTDLLSIDHVFIRGGFQQFSDEDTMIRLSAASSITGRFNTPHIQSYELSLMTSYEIDNHTFEDFLFNTVVDVNDDLRLRSAYELYQPKEPFIGFRQQFYAVYAFGRQDLWRSSADYQWNDYLQTHVEFIRSSRNKGMDKGYGGSAGVKWTYLRNIALEAEIDYLELGQDKSESLYFSANYSATAALKVGVNLALSNNYKRLYGNNESIGVELNGKYRIDNALFLNLSSRYIEYAQIDDEYLLTAQLTWYFDHFQAKLDR